MDGSTVIAVVALIGVAVLVVLWIRVRAFEMLAAQEMNLLVEATRQAIDSLPERLSPLDRDVGMVDDRRKGRRGRWAKRTKS